jgi:excisionase family DNA binding protein
MDKILVTRQEAARALAISTRAVDYLIRTGKLPSRKLGKRRLVHVSALEAFARRDCGRISPGASDVC